MSNSSQSTQIHNTLPKLSLDVPGIGLAEFAPGIFFDDATGQMRINNWSCAIEGWGDFSGSWKSCVVRTELVNALTSFNESEINVIFGGNSSSNFRIILLENEEFQKINTESHALFVSQENILMVNRNYVSESTIRHALKHILAQNSTNGGSEVEGHFRDNCQFQPDFDYNKFEQDGVDYRDNSIEFGGDVYAVDGDVTDKNLRDNNLAAISKIPAGYPKALALSLNPHFLQLRNLRYDLIDKSTQNSPNVKDKYFHGISIFKKDTFFEKFGDVLFHFDNVTKRLSLRDGYTDTEVMGHILKHLAPDPEKLTEHFRNNCSITFEKQNSWVEVDGVRFPCHALGLTSKTESQFRIGLSLSLAGFFSTKALKSLLDSPDNLATKDKKILSKRKEILQTTVLPDNEFFRSNRDGPSDAGGYYHARYNEITLRAYAISPFYIAHEFFHKYDDRVFMDTKKQINLSESGPVFKNYHLRYFFACLSVGQNLWPSRSLKDQFKLGRRLVKKVLGLSFEERILMSSKELLPEVQGTKVFNDVFPEAVGIFFPRDYAMTSPTEFFAEVGRSFVTNDLNREKFPEWVEAWSQWQLNNNDPKILEQVLQTKEHLLLKNLENFPPEARDLLNDYLKECKVTP